MRHGVSEIQAERLGQDLKDLAMRSDDELRKRWRCLYGGTQPPRRIHRSLLIAAVGYRMQENALGGFKPSARRHLMRVAGNAEDGRQPPGCPSLSPKPGTVLVRDWGGGHPFRCRRCWKSGILFRGKQYKSLSEVARVITGSRWSGPLFFGLKSTVKEQNHGTR